MNILKNILRNIFRRKRITKTRLRACGQNHIEVLNGKNDAGQFDTMISQTTDTYIKFFGKLTGEASDLAIQKAKTQIVDSIMLQFEKKVRRDYPLITSKYFNDTPEYTEFFPGGLTEFNRITKEKFEIICNRFLGTLNTYQGGVLTPQMVTDYTAIRDNYVSAHAVQTDKKSDVKTFRLEGKVARLAFENQLYKNLHNLAAMYCETPELVYEFFDTTLLFPHTHHEDDDTIDEEFSVELQTHETKNSGLTNIVGKKARFINLTDAKVLIWTVASLDNLEPSATALTLDADGEVEVLLSELGGPDFPFLILRNLSDELEAEVVIEWVE
jgi:hypothetical protein